MTSEVTLEPLAKRRKLGVHKPFVSPMKQRSNQPSRPTSSDGIFKKPATPSSNLSKTTTFTPHHPYTPTPSRSSSSLVRPSTTTTTTPTFTSPLSNSTSTSTTALHANLLTLRAQLDTLKQTQRILSQSKAAELISLRDKWRLATRSAAEELYANTKDRVNRMGGVSAWREGEMRRRERVEEWAREDRERAEREEDVISSSDDDNDESEGDDEDEEEDEDGDGKKTKVTPAEKARLKASRKAQRAASRAFRLETREARREAREMAQAEMAEENEEVEEQGREMARKADLEKGLVGGDDDGYTMAMMLSQLNVDLEMIGFDREAGRWMD